MTLVEKDKNELRAWLPERIGDREQAIAEMRQSTADAMWLSKEYKRLLETYEDQWVAVRECEVRESAPTLDDLLAIIDAGAMERDHFVIRRIQRHHMTFVG